MNTWNADHRLRIFIAPDSYKSTASATQAADYLARGVRQGLEDAGIPAAHTELTIQPLADGGEGTAALFGATAYTVPTTTANGTLTEAAYFYDDNTHTAYIDIAAASGLPAVSADLRATRADTYGTGVLIAAALGQGAKEIVLGLGGSATTDGGSGILVALGAQLRNAAGLPLAPGGSALAQLDHIDLTHLNPQVPGVKFRLLHDVTNPATGDTGCAYIFGPQKGSSAADCASLDAGIAQLCAVTEIDPTTPGFGAAGGTAIALTWLTRIFDPSGASCVLEPGAHALLEMLDQTAALRQADLIITGEGACDQTSFGGKVVGTLRDTASASTPLWVAAGSLAAGTTLPEHTYFQELIDAPVAEQLETAGAAIIAEFVTSQNS